LPGWAFAAFSRVEIRKIAYGARVIFEVAIAADVIFPARDGSASAVAAADRNCVWSPEDKGFCDVRSPRFGTGGCIQDGKATEKESLD
jgi:hypothetical protein